MAGMAGFDLVYIALQAASAGAASAPHGGLWEAIRTFINTPAPYSPFTEYLAVLLFLWLLARRGRRRSSDGNFSRQAQDVLEAKHAAGELSEQAFEKYRQDAALRPRH